MGQVTIDGIPVFRALVDAGDAETGMFRISLVDAPAVESNFLAFDKQRRQILYAVENEEKRLVLGVVMRADFPIYRKDNTAGEYFIIYTADTIRTMAEKYLIEGRQNEVNIMHEAGSDVTGVDMVQYFIKDSAKGVAPAGFEDIADGSLFAEFHVVNDDVWDAIKAGTYKGFSLEGVFDLVPEQDKDFVQDVVDTLDGLFKKHFNPKQYTTMAKVKGLMARIAAAIAAEAEEVKMGKATTDKGILVWDGEEDLKAGDKVYIEDQDGNRTAAEDGNYVTEDGKTIIVVDGAVSEITDPKAEVSEEGAAEPARFVETDKGKLEWDNEDEDLKEGDAVYITDEEGNRNPAPDGDYTTEDGKVISVVDGKVASISDGKAEVAPEVEARMEKILRKKAQFEESFDEKYRAIAAAIGEALGHEDFYIEEAGEDYAVACVWDEDWNDKFYRYAVTWNEDGTANVADPVEVKPVFVPVDFVSPFEKGEDAEKEELRSQIAALTAEKETLTARVTELEKEPAGKPAHEDFTSAVAPGKTGNKGLDRLANLMAQK